MQEGTAMSELTRKQVVKILFQFGIDLRAEWRDDWRALASTDASLRTRLAQQTARADTFKLVTKQHADGLRGIVQLIEQGKVDHALQWAKDSLSGYTEPIESTTLKLQQQVAKLTAKLAAVERETIERCAKVAEGGRFLSDTSMEAQWGTACAAAIRREQGA